MTKAKLVGVRSALPPTLAPYLAVDADFTLEAEGASWRTVGINAGQRRFGTVIGGTVTSERPFEHGPAKANHPADVYREAWRLLEDKIPQQAIEILDPAIEKEPASTSLRTLRAWAYFQSAQLHKAETELTLLVEECPSDVWARFALARVLERQSRYADALPHMRLAAVMSGDPEHEAGVLRVERLAGKL